MNSEVLPSVAAKRPVPLSRAEAFRYLLKLGFIRFGEPAGQITVLHGGRYVPILLGAPFIETAHGNLRFTAPLTAITVAVVGVIVKPAAFAHFRLKLRVIPVIAGSAAAGLAVQLAGAALRVNT